VSERATRAAASTSAESQSDEKIASRSYRTLTALSRLS
jgi:hypothetical protein